MSAGQRIGAYELERLIARGGMAVVWVARDARTGRRVALKQVRLDASSDEEYLLRFRHEVRIHAGLRHPNVLAIYEYEASAERSFIAMELAEGGSLKGLLERGGPLPVDVALFIAREMLAGLSCAHAAGVVHRDVKPQNVLLGHSGAVKVADFGISKSSEMTRLTHTGDILGTPAYMSPEQCSGGALDARSDVFSTGIVLYEMLCGTNPFNTGNAVSTLRMILERPPAPVTEIDPRIPVECESLLARMLAKRPDDRFASADQARAAVDACLRGLGARDLDAALRAFIADPVGYRQRRYGAEAAAHLARAKTLLASGVASDEVVLWELFHADRLDPQNQHVRGLLEQVAGRTGYSLVVEPASGRTAELERKLEAEPGNVALLLQLAKQHKLARRFPSLMRVFMRLRSLQVSDPYLRGQVAALVARPGAAATTGIHRAALESRTDPAGTVVMPAISPRAGASRAPATVQTAATRVVHVEPRPASPARRRGAARDPRLPLLEMVGFVVAALLMLLGALLTIGG